MYRYFSTDKYAGIDASGRRNKQKSFFINTSDNKSDTVNMSIKQNFEVSVSNGTDK